ncbi:choice-of-anchor M domain-containing protein [Microbacterium sp. NPDC096154]|uniref:choice-of-anchor M domain-containing protein n=1 Tax=Microbacterium sp. NPDC096154 TaxID=3155549 RepID=UPI0033306227
MTSLLTRPRPAVATGVGLALAASLLGATAAHAAGPYDDRNVLSQGHADAFYIEKDAAGEPALAIHSDEFGTHAPEEFVIQGKPSVASRTAGASVASVLGIESGASYYLLPQTNQPGQVFLGFGYDTADYPAGSIEVTHTITDFEGPGTFAAWQNGDEGPVEWLNSAKDDWSFTSTANHEHLNWGFTAEGEYTFDVTSTFSDGGVEKIAGPQTYTFFVGEDLPQDAEPEPGATSLSISGVAAHYHTGNVASLTAVQSPEPVSDHFHWFTRASADAEWTAVDGAYTDSYGFVVTGEQQVKAVVYDHDHNAIAESDPVQIHVDDHGSTPGVGPEIAVSLKDTEGALVISVAADSKRSELSDLKLNPQADRYVSDGAIGGITVADTRAGSPGWSASGRVRELGTVDGAVLSGKYLGWTPKVVSASDGQQVAAGPSVSTGFIEGSGISGWSVLGSAAAGSSTGTAVLGADLHIEAPTTTQVGDYAGVVLITVI